MPLFLKNKLLFLHIPKCGGDTINHALRVAGDTPFLFVDDGSVLVNGHTPQHLTWRELVSAGWHTPPGFRVAALVRHPVDRVKSAYRYVLCYRPDLHYLGTTPSEFLSSFLSREPQIFLKYDHHNLGLLDFLRNESGNVESSIFTMALQDMNVWLAELGLPEIEPSQYRNVTKGLRVFPDFGASDLDRIRDYYSEDIRWFEKLFPHCALEPQV